jgi:inactivated superfamily I helicase
MAMENVKVVEQVYAVWEGVWALQCRLDAADFLHLSTSPLARPGLVFRASLDAERVAWWSRGQWASGSHAFAVLRRIFNAATTNSAPPTSFTNATPHTWTLECQGNVRI